MDSWISAYLSWALVFAYAYPLFMAYVWMVGGLQYFFKWEHGRPTGSEALKKRSGFPPVSILVPCHNEGENLRETIAALDQQNYPDFEIVAINDGSTDNTGELLDELGRQYPRLRVVHLVENQGKATALRMGALTSLNEFLICVDGDALLDIDASAWIIKHFINNCHVGAVTGNPRVRTRSTLLGKIQVGEFSSIIGLIKRAQRIYGRVFTISGVVAGFRKSALLEVGYWSPDAITEDIDISWKLHLAGWDIRFEPNALCWILMPETFRGLWSQRLRWAQGGVEVFVRYLPQILHFRQRRLWLLFAEYLVSVLWAYTILSLILLWPMMQFIPQMEGVTTFSILPGSAGLLLGLTCLLQFAVSFYIDGRYEKGLGKLYYWMIWYPLVYWLINLLTLVVAVPKALLRPRGKRATWVSPDRGVRP
ncbi:MAG: poly-beta-1,6 N-acetyl-D-glucosamine synthase [Gammaproteobacteria bacterium]|nr:poly-beta-1,6 N-acetyl-D-glucosamine synthase [Gammaproteobacteria bacterium]MCF6363988.1 poly-beta-1,6 N-acetyl-D-glucosamine synthase [Gammaproteobacteria bacterium]